MVKFHLAARLVASAVVPFLLGASAPNVSDTKVRVHVKYHTGLEAPHEVAFDWPAVDEKVGKSKFFSCMVTSSLEAVRSIKLDCLGPQRYRAQTTALCAVNNSPETAAYLFVAKVGTMGANLNFYVWCAP
jgi:hypothetical protein